MSDIQQMDPAKVREVFDSRRAPRGPYRRQTTMKNCSFLLDLEARETLQKLAEHKLISKGEALRRAIAAYAKRELPRTEQAKPQ